MAPVHFDDPADESRQDLREIRIRSWKEMEPRKDSPSRAIRGSGKKKNVRQPQG